MGCCHVGICSEKGDELIAELLPSFPSNIYLKCLHILRSFSSVWYWLTDFGASVCVSSATVLTLCSILIPMTRHWSEHHWVGLLENCSLTSQDCWTLEEVWVACWRSVVSSVSLFGLQEIATDQLPSLLYRIHQSTPRVTTLLRHIYTAYLRLA